MKKINFYIETPIGHSVNEAIAIANTKAPTADSTPPFKISAKIAYKGTADILADTIRINSRTTYEVEMTADTSNGIVIGMIGLFTAESQLNVNRIDPITRWTIDVDPSLYVETTPTSMSMDDFRAMEQPSSNYYMRANLDTIPLDKIIDKITDAADTVEDDTPDGEEEDNPFLDTNDNDADERRYEQEQRNREIAEDIRNDKRAYYYDR